MRVTLAHPETIETGLNARACVQKSLICLWPERLRFAFIIEYWLWWKLIGLMGMHLTWPISAVNNVLLEWHNGIPLDYMSSVSTETEKNRWIWIWITKRHHVKPDKQKQTLVMWGMKKKWIYVIMTRLQNPQQHTLLITKNLRSFR